LCVVLALAEALGCSAVASPAASTNTLNAELGSLNVRLAESYRRRDPAAYAALYTDSAVFAWPGLAPVRGPAALGSMVQEMWAAERDVDLRLRAAARRVSEGHASEFGALSNAGVTHPG
jgi:ketosteroid isomerase-like protein